MSAASPPALAALDRIAARAADVGGTASIEPRLLTAFERQSDLMRLDNEEPSEVASATTPRRESIAAAALPPSPPSAEREPEGEARQIGEPAAAALQPFAFVPALTPRADAETLSSPHDIERDLDHAVVAGECGELVQAAPRAGRPEQLRLDDAAAPRQEAPPERAEALRSPPPVMATVTPLPPAARPLAREPVHTGPQSREPRRQAMEAPPQAAASPVVEVTIGRVEIRAAPPPVSAQRVAPTSAAKPSRLELYLGRRSAGMRS
jgi:hypothetical protein